MKKLNPILISQGNCAFTNNGSFVMAYKLILPEIFSLNPQQYEDTYKMWHSCIKRLPEGCYIHRVDVCTEKPFEDEILPNRSYFQKAYRRHFEKRIMLDHQAYVFFAWPKVKTLSENLANPFAANVKIKEAAAEQHFINEDFKTAVEAEVGYLNRSKLLTALPLSEAEVNYFNFQYFNLFDTNNSTTIDFTQSIKIDNQSVHLTIGDKLVGAFSIYNENQLPNEINTIVRDPLVETKQGFQTTTGDLLGIYARKPHILSTVIFRDSKADWVKKIESKALEFERFSFMSQGFKTQAGNLYKLKDELTGEYNDEFIVRSNTTVIFWEETKKEYKETKGLFDSIFKGADVVPSYPVGKHLKNIIVVSNPYFSGSNSDLNLYPNFLSVPLTFFPMVSNYTSDDKGLFFCDRFNIPFRQDIWDERKKYIKARNFLMLAPTGEGKSFFLQELMRQMYEAGMILVIIDLGKSFKKFAELLGDDAAYIEYKQGSAMGVNPFNRPAEELLNPEKLNGLGHFIFAHVESEHHAEEEQLIFLRKIIKYYIETQQVNLSFAHFCFWVCDNESEIQKKFKEELQFFDFAKMKMFLSEFIGDGVYSFLYSNNEENNHISASLRNKKVVVFEIDEAKDNAKIIGILLQTIKDTIYTNIWNDKSKKGIILFEEFAKTLKIGNVLSQVEFYYQAIRKQEGGIGIVLQSTTQIPENSTASSIFENTQITYALYNQRGYDIMKDRLNLKHEHSLALLNSLKNDFSGQRKYSEIFIKQGDRERVARLEVSREQYLAFITDGEEQNQLLKLQAQGISIYEAIQKLL